MFPCVYIVVARNAGNGRGVFTAALTVAVFRASENKFLRSYNRTVKWQRFIRNDYAPVVYQRGYTPRACVCARHSLAPLRSKLRTTSISFFSPFPSFCFALPRLDSRSIIEDQSVHGSDFIPSRCRIRERLRTREQTRGYAWNEWEKPRLFYTFICTVLVDKTGCRKLRFQPQNEKRVC